MVRGLGLAFIFVMICACTAEPVRRAAPSSPAPSNPAQWTAIDLNTILQTPMTTAKGAASPPTAVVTRASRAAVAYGAELVVVWDIARRREIFRVDPGGIVGRLALSPDGHRLAAEIGDKHVSVWDVTTRERIARFTGPGFPHFDQTGGKLLVADYWAAVVHDLGSKRRVAFSREALPMTEGYEFPGFASDGSVIAVGHTFWASWAPPASPKPTVLDYSMGTVSLSGDGSHMVASAWLSAEAQLAVVWDLRTRRQVASWDVPGQPYGMACLDDACGQVVVAVGEYRGADPVSTRIDAFGGVEHAKIWSVRLPPSEQVLLNADARVVTVRTDHEIVVIDRDGKVAEPRGRNRTAKPFIGEWHVHGSELEIRPDLSGLMIFNAGPCSPNRLEVGCSGHVSISFTLEPSGLVGKVTSVVYKDPAGKVIHDFVGGDDLPEPGDTFTLERVDTGVLRRIQPTAGLGNPYFCGPTASRKWRLACN
ncbi:YncE family protein [Nonomuraea sediminis]|uniref:YncE family protein n=1 Tax=Nonomuraea sediminis TaxID=2835864 RepID=UPI001BDC649D|nr:hypothetical protein [Nonomuraea sediminis]